MAFLPLAARRGSPWPRPVGSTRYRALPGLAQRRRKPSICRTDGAALLLQWGYRL